MIIKLSCRRIWEFRLCSHCHDSPLGREEESVIIVEETNRNILPSLSTFQAPLYKYKVDHVTHLNLSLWASLLLCQSHTSIQLSISVSREFMTILISLFDPINKRENKVCPQTFTNTLYLIAIRWYDHGRVGNLFFFELLQLEPTIEIWFEGFRTA